MPSNLSKVLSILFHPLAMPTFGCALVIYYCRTAFPLSSAQLWLLLALVFTFTTLLPSISIYTLYNSRFIHSLRLRQKQDRMIALVVATVYFTLLTYLVLDKLGLELLLSEVITGMAITLACITLLSPFFTVSAHTTAISGVLGVMIGLQYAYDSFELLYPILLLVMLSGFLMSARLALQLRTLWQILPGFVIGFSICCTTVVFMAN